MAHELQQDFIRRVKGRFPKYFNDVKVLDIGSLDINGNAKHFFSHPLYYVGVDLSEGDNVNVVSSGHLYDSGFQFDVVMSAECFEHDMYYPRTISNMIRLLKSNGLMIFTCASTGRPEHGTLRSTPSDAPFLQHIDERWANYYKNLTEDDIRAIIDVNDIFIDYNFEYEPNSCDLYFWGIKK
jgi:SAM-dependent methyltransferase